MSSPILFNTSASELIGNDRNPSLLKLIDANENFERRYPEQFQRLTGVCVSIVSEFTLQSLIEPIRYFSRILGIEPSIEFAPPYQIESHLLGSVPISGPNSNHISLVIFDLEKMCPQHSVHPSADYRAGFEVTLQRRLRLCKDFSDRTSTRVVVATLFPMYQGISVGFSNSEAFSRHSFVEEGNRALETLCGELGLEVLPLHHALNFYGVQNCLSLKSYLSSDAPFSPEGANRVSEIIARQLSSYFTKRKKVLVLDLDNTLWKGVLGEDGLAGIKFRPDCFEGRVFWHALSHIKALADAGVVLAINSKNNEQEVNALLDSPDFPLNRGDFACIKANWIEKSENMLAISEELGLSLDSMVMLDDSEVECARLRQMCPDVIVVQVPKKDSEYPALLAALPFFERPRVTEADSLRKQDYQNIVKRKELATRSESFDDFLKTLQIELSLFSADAKSFDRIEQLFERTNQFNMTGKRYRRPELEEIRRGGGLVLGASYKDSFGSSGVIGALVVTRQGDTAVVENFVVSCRVLGRCVERNILASINEAFYAGALKSLQIRFEETTRNVPAKLFLGELGLSSSGSVSVDQLVSSPFVTVVTREAGK